MKMKCDVVMWDWQTVDEIKRGKSTPYIIGKESYTPGAIKIGTADVEITFHDDTEILAEQIKTAEAELQAVRAENQQRENVILDKISKLKSLTWEPV